MSSKSYKVLGNESKRITYDNFIEYNLENDTTEINRNVERKLNAYGITDEEIERIPQDYLEKYMSRMEIFL